MLNKKIVELINSQINKELFSAYLYLDISNFYDDKNLDGFGNWFRVQAQEERDHAMIFLQYLRDNGEKIILDSIANPGKEYKDFKQPLIDSYDHELFITRSIHEIYAEAQSQKDFRTMQFLDFFVKEQGEEEMNADDLCKRFDLFGGEARSLYLLDSELKTRVYTPVVL